MFLASTGFLIPERQIFQNVPALGFNVGNIFCNMNLLLLVGVYYPGHLAVTQKEEPAMSALLVEIIEAVKAGKQFRVIDNVSSVDVCVHPWNFRFFLAKLIPAFIGFPVSDETAGVGEFPCRFVGNADCCRLSIRIRFCADPADALGGTYKQLMPGCGSAIVCLGLHMQVLRNVAPAKQFLEVKHVLSSLKNQVVV